MKCFAVHVHHVYGLFHPFARCLTFSDIFDMQNAWNTIMLFGIPKAKDPGRPVSGSKQVPHFVWR